MLDRGKQTSQRQISQAILPKGLRKVWMNSFSIRKGVWQWELRSVWGLVGLSASSDNSYTAAPILVLLFLEETK